MSSAADQEMDIAVGRMLRIGVTVAACVVFAGWLFYLVQAHGVAPNYRHFHGTPIFLAKPGSIFRGIGSLDPRSLIDLGILLLIATPVARVVFCIVSFARQKDRLYVLVSATVLAILIFCLFFRS